MGIALLLWDFSCSVCGRLPLLCTGRGRDVGFLDGQCRVPLLGFFLGPKKESPPNSDMPLLGAHVRLASEYVECILPDRERSGIILDLRNVLRANRLAPAQAANQRGRLGCAHSLFFGKVGRAAQLGGIRPPPFEGGSRISRPCFFGASRPPLMHPALVYADADGCGHIGAVIYHKGMAYRASAHLPPGLRPVEIGFASMGSLQLFLA